MFKLLFQVADFIFKAVLFYASTDEGEAEFDDIQRELIAVGVPLDADSVTPAEDPLVDVDWLRGLQNLTTEELQNIVDAAERGGGETAPTIHDAQQLPLPTKDPNRFKRGR